METAWRCKKNAVKRNDSDYQQEISTNGDDATGLNDISDLYTCKNNRRKGKSKLFQISIVSPRKTDDDLK